MGRGSSKASTKAPKISSRMTYQTLLGLPDSREKFLALEKKLLTLQHHGPVFFEAQDEWKRMYKKYRKKK